MTRNVHRVPPAHQALIAAVLISPICIGNISPDTAMEKVNAILDASHCWLKATPGFSAPPLLPRVKPQLTAKILAIHPYAHNLVFHITKSNPLFDDSSCQRHPGLSVWYLSPLLY